MEQSEEMLERRLNMKDLPNTVASVKPGGLCVSMHDELIVCK